MSRARQAVAVKAKPKAVKAIKPATPKKDSIRELVGTLYAAILDAKAVDIVVLDLRKISTVADYIVIASGTSSRQVQAIAGRLIDAARTKASRRPLGVEGTENAKWALVDYGDVVCHIFEEETRSFYRLENLWHDAKQVQFGKKAKSAPAKKKTLKK